MYSKLDFIYVDGAMSCFVNVIPNHIQELFSQQWNISKDIHVTSIMLKWLNEEVVTTDFMHLGMQIALDTNRDMICIGVNNYVILQMGELLVVYFIHISNEMFLHIKHL